MDMHRKFPLNIAIIFLVIFFWGIVGTAMAGTSSYGNWTKVAENVSSVYLKNGYGIAVFHDKIWVIGGQTMRGASVLAKFDTGETDYTGGKKDNTSEIWSSIDGKTWTMVTEEAGFRGRISPGVAVFRDRLWVIGGTGFDDVWSSSDGRKWIQENEHAGFSPRGKMGVAVFHDRLWVIAGGTHYPFWEHANMTDDIWSSADGRVWRRETEHAGFGPRFGYGVVVFNDRLWMIDGLSDHVLSGGGWTGGGQDVWSSENGANWTQVKDKLPFGWREFAPATVFDNKLWIIGGGYRMIHMGHPEVPYTYNNVWSSTDGIKWSLETEEPGFNIGYGPVLVFKDAIWDIGPNIWKMPLQKSPSKLSLDYPSTPIPQPSPTGIPETVPSYLVTILPVTPVNTDMQPPSPSMNPTPHKSAVPTRAGIEPIMSCLNLMIPIGVVILVKKSIEK
jgi:hypothetical protein